MTKTKPIKKLLAANRSEIAIRIFRAATELGLRTVAIYSEEDRLALHRFKADEAYQVGAGKGPVQAYLDIDGIIALAKEHDVDAIHPGYGFLSENPAFARACEKAGITFVGPTPNLLELLGDKTAARKLAASAGVPTLPGTEDPVQSPEEAKRIAKEIGYPVIVKAAFGGGGRGMRVVRDETQLAASLEEAQGEAQVGVRRCKRASSKNICRARGILKCRFSATRTETCCISTSAIAPSSGGTKKWSRLRLPRISPRMFAMNSAMPRSSSRAKPNYRNAGTVEFLFDADEQKVYFIEVNPRIQVEHTVTEMVTGIDLVQSQILVAQGHKLHEAPHVAARVRKKCRSMAPRCNAALRRKIPQIILRPITGKFRRIARPPVSASASTAERLTPARFSPHITIRCW